MEPGRGHRATEWDDDGGRALHARLLQQDPTATVDLAETYLSPLVEWLRRTFSERDDTLLETVAADLILKLGMQPEQYDPACSTLSAYLRMAARGDVKNARDKEHRRSQHLVSLADVEVHQPARNSEWSGASDPADAVIGALDHEKVLAMREHFDERDWACVMLQLDGERRTAPYALVLGLRDRTRDEQEREVKRVKDRLKKRLQRVWRRMYGDG
jgi:hypothetical protein